MQKNRSIFYALAAVAIIVIIGIIFLTRERQTPPRPDKPEITKVGPMPKIPIERETDLPQIPEPTPGEPDKKEAAQTQKSSVQGSELTISGIVTLSNGSPASEARISLTKINIGESQFDDKPLTSATADKNGKYSVRIARLPIVFIKASYPGYAAITAVAGSATSGRGASVSGGKQEVIINFTLPPASYVKGRVVDENDKPIEGVFMTFVFMDQPKEIFSMETTVTDNQGRFEFQNIPPGKITVSAGSLDFTPQSQDVTAPADDLIFKLLPATASLSGRVFHKISGEAITSATVSLVFIQQLRLIKIPHKTSVTDPTGFYSFDRLPSGQYVITAQKDDLFMFKFDGNFQTLDLKENEKREGLNLFLYEGHIIKGRVTDKNTGAPIEGVKVSTAWGAAKPREDITNAEGSYRLEGLSGTRMGLTAEKENYILAEEEQHIVHTGITLNPEEMELTEDIQMIPGLFISGRVETEQGLPPTNAQVYLYQTNDWAARDKAHPVDRLGMFKLVVAPFTSCLVKAEVKGSPVAFSDPIQVQDKSIENIVIVMKQAASISGIVQDMDKKPVEGAIILAQIPLAYGNLTSYEYLRDVEILSDSKGQFKAQNLPSGKIILSAEKDGYAGSKQEIIPVNPGEEKTDVILQLTKASFLAGKITDPEGHPIENVQIFVHANFSSVNSQGQSQSDADGNYRIEGLYDAPHNVDLHHDKYGNEYHQNIEVGREDANFVMGSNRITLIGNVRDWKTGNPIRNFNVSANGLKPEKDPEIPGRFVIRNLKPDFGFRLKIESEGYMPNDTRSFSLPKGENIVEKTFELSPGGGIKGRVVNKATREPMEEVIVHLFTSSGVNEMDVAYSGNEWQVSRGEPTKILTTRKDGVFNFEAVPAESCFIRFIPLEPFKPGHKNITVKHGEITDMGDVEISGGGGIKGKLVQMPDEKPMTGKIITLRSFGWQIPEQNAVTNEQGRFEFLSIMSGIYIIEAKEYNIIKSADVKDDATCECVLRVGTGSLKGVVLRKGVPQESVRITLYPISQGGARESNTDSKGVFEITNLVPGKWKVDFQAGYYIPTPIEEVIDIAADAVTEKVFELPSGRIVGKVVNAKDEPIEGALISARLMQVADAEDAVHPRTWTAISEKDGAFAIADMPSSSYAVSASKKDMGLALVENVVVPENADSSPVLFKIDAGKGGTLVSVALNLGNGQPVPEAWCYLTTAEGARFDHGRQRGQDGVITIPNIPAGTYKVQVSSWGFSVHEHNVEIKDGVTVNLEDVMYEAGDLRWTVLDAEGQPVSNAPCRIEPLDANSIEKSREGRTDVQGLWIQRGLYPGGYRVTTRLSDGRQATDTIEIQARQLIQKTAVVKLAPDLRIE